MAAAFTAVWLRYMSISIRMPYRERNRLTEFGCWQSSSMLSVTTLDRENWYIMDRQANVEESMTGKARTYAEVVDEIKKNFEGFSPQFQAAVRYLLDQPDEIAVSSMRSVAAKANVQSATLVRLAQHMGFSGWPELKALFVEWLRASPHRYAVRAKSLTSQAGPEELFAELFRTQRSNIDAIAASNPAFLQAARLIEKAKDVYIAGFRACHPIAFTLQYLYRFFRWNVTRLGGGDSSLEMGLRAIQRGDAVIVISFAPYSREALTVVQVARRKGCKIVAMTDSFASPLARNADVTILFSVQSPSFFPSIVSGIAAAEALVELLASRSGSKTVRRIEQAEQQLFELGYVTHDVKKPPRKT
jgi:DNA-binding MurR/RpiR family transcriptional regulator